MEPSALTAAITRIVQDTTAAQGKPEGLADPAAIIKVGRILRRGLEESQQAVSAGR